MTDPADTKRPDQGMEEGVVRRGTVVYAHPETGEIINAGPGDPVWVDAEEMATLRARGIVVDPDSPLSVAITIGPAMRDDTAMMGRSGNMGR